MFLFCFVCIYTNLVLSIVSRTLSCCKMILILVLALLLSSTLTILHSVHETNLLFAVWTLQFLFKPIVNAGYVKYMLARKWFYLSSRYEHLKTDRAQNLIFSPLNFFALPLSETFGQAYFRRRAWSERLQRFATVLYLITSCVIWLNFVFWNPLKLFFNELEAWYRINDVPDLFRLG